MENTNLKKSPGLPDNYFNLSEEKITSLITKEISKDATLEEMFEAYIECGCETFKNSGKLKPAAFLICRSAEGDVKTAIYPMYNEKPGDMKMHSQILRKIVESLYANAEVKLEGIVIGMDAFMSVVNSPKEAENLQPRNDPKAIDVLHFTLETSEGKHIKCYSYVKGPEGQVILDPKPVMDEKMPYNAESDEANFGFFMKQKTL